MQKYDCTLYIYTNINTKTSLYTLHDLGAFVCRKLSMQSSSQGGKLQSTTFKFSKGNSHGLIVIEQHGSAGLTKFFSS